MNMNKTKTSKIKDTILGLAPILLGFVYLFLYGIVEGAYFWSTFSFLGFLIFISFIEELQPKWFKALIIITKESLLSGFVCIVALPLAIIWKVFLFLLGIAINVIWFTIKLMLFPIVLFLGSFFTAPEEKDASKTL